MQSDQIVASTEAEDGRSFQYHLSTDRGRSFQYHHACIEPLFTPPNNLLTCFSCGKMLGLDWFQAQIFDLSANGFGRSGRTTQGGSCPDCGQPQLDDRLRDIWRRCRCGFQILKFQKQVLEGHFQIDDSEKIEPFYAHDWCKTKRESSSDVLELQARLRTVEAEISIVSSRLKEIPAERTKMPENYASTLTLIVAVSVLLLGVFDLITFWTDYIGDPVERFFAFVWRVVTNGITVLVFAGGGWLVGALIGWLRSKTVGGSAREEQNLSKRMRDLGESKTQISQSLNRALAQDRTKPYLLHPRTN